MIFFLFRSLAREYGVKTTVGISDDEMCEVTREFVVDFHYVLIMYESTVEPKPNHLILICLRQRTTNFQLKNTKTSRATAYTSDAREKMYETA